jgi:shikimate kinase
MKQPPAEPGKDTAEHKDPSAKRIARLTRELGSRSIVLIGLMGAGKTSIGKRLAARLGLPFTDADSEIESAAGQRIDEIFAEHGEAYFRQGERRVIARLLRSGPQVLATGGGAFMDAGTRERIAASGISIWLRAELPVLMKRVKRRSDRPLLKRGDAQEIMRKLLEERSPVYAKADLTVDSHEAPHDTIVGEIVEMLEQKLIPDRSRGAADLASKG